MRNFIKPMWRKEEKLLFFRTEKLEKRLRQKGKSPLPAARVRHNIKKFNLGRWQEYTPISIKVTLGFGHLNAEYNAMLCLSVYQTMAFKDQSTIPKATFLERGVYNVAMWTYEVTWSARTKELSQRSSFCGQIFFDIRVLFGRLWADTYLWWPKLVRFSVSVFSLLY